MNPVVSELIEILKDVGAFKEQALRERFPALHPARFGQLLTRAKDILRSEHKIEFGPSLTNPGMQVRCDDSRKLDRAVRKRRAAKRKLDRAKATLAAIDESQLEEKQIQQKTREEMNLGTEQAYVARKSRRRTLPGVAA